MAGVQHYRLALDPSLQKARDVTLGRYKYFKFNRRSAHITFTLVFIVPTILGIVAYQTDGKFDFRAKRRGDSILEY
ncbi:NADH:ubiquinone oxidoreductase 6.6kD subunit [Durotheca rogersii]|uniref:NADH:ubiquinone oxidoreductase 6.6kD subunit n=1 Tax=Durotheca rogersii TaxID=419775 RepID=UPI0022208112|nr:NADH:ubiquinone oxidoreductase 6.6kD subunit [Durotheca rogersii]KAI5863250.1 NADH:ubiquinone oxidoreductase 6.6kD subunit [Durotheca rogersii]